MPSYCAIIIMYFNLTYIYTSENIIIVVLKQKRRIYFYVLKYLICSETFTAFCITKLPSGNDPFHCYK